jgi:cytochrome c-type biogenesis protein CcmH/NrfG
LQAGILGARDARAPPAVPEAEGEGEMKFYDTQFGELKTDRNGMIVPTRAGTQASARTRRLTLDEREQRPVFRLICGFAAILAVGVLYVNYAETVHLWTMSRPAEVRYLEMQLGRAYERAYRENVESTERSQWLTEHLQSVCGDMYRQKASDLSLEETDVFNSKCRVYLP